MWLSGRSGCAGAGDEAVDARARAELPDFQYAAFQQGQAQARDRHVTRAEYAFMTEEEIEADIAQRAAGGRANIDRRDSDERATAHAIRAEIRDEVLAARAADPAGWAMRDADVAASFAKAAENPDDPILTRKAIQQRLALQREMGIEQPRLLSDAERDQIAETLAQATPADRPAIIADLRARYGPQAGMLAAELTGEVDSNTALLIAHADMPQLPRLLANGMAKLAKDGPATLTLARHLDYYQLPELPILDRGEHAQRKLAMSQMKPGQHYRLPNGDVALYDGDALTPMKMEVVTPLGDDPQFFGKNWSQDQRDQFNHPMRLVKQAFTGMNIFSQLDEIEKRRARRRGERTELWETPRRQEQLEAAPPTGKPDIADLTEEEWRADQAESRNQLGESVESFSRNYRKLEEKLAPVEFLDDPGGWLLRAAGKAGAKAVEDLPVIPDQYRLLVRTLREYDVDPGDSEAVMEALYDDEFRSLLDKRRDEWAGNTAFNAILGETKEIDYDGGEQAPLASGEERDRPQEAGPQARRIWDKLANVGYGTEIDNIMMEIYRLRSIDKGIRPDLLLTPRQAEQYRDRVSGSQTRHDRYAKSPPYPGAAVNRGMVDRLAEALEKQGKARDRLAASEARPGGTDDPVAAAWRIGGDALMKIPNMIPGVAQVIGANEAFYKTIAEFEVDPKDYRAMAELAITVDFAEKWKANYDNYMVNIPVRMTEDYLKKLGLSEAKAIIK